MPMVLQLPQPTHHLNSLEGWLPLSQKVPKSFPLNLFYKVLVRRLVQSVALFLCLLANHVCALGLNRI